MSLPASRRHGRSWSAFVAVHRHLGRRRLAVGHSPGGFGSEPPAVASRRAR